MARRVSIYRPHCRCEHIGATPILVSLALLLASCSLAPQRARPARAASLAPPYQALEMLLGSWEAASRATFEDSDRVLEIRTTVEADWDLGHFVVARSASSFTDAASRETSSSESVSWFTWDAALGGYLYWTFRSDGTVASGTMAYDPPTRKWSLEEIEQDDAGRLVVTGRGTMEYTSDSEKVVRWESRPLDGPGFRSEGRSRRILRTKNGK